MEDICYPVALVFFVVIFVMLAMPQIFYHAEKTPFIVLISHTGCPIQMILLRFFNNKKFTKLLIVMQFVFYPLGNSQYLFFFINCLKAKNVMHMKCLCNNNKYLCRRYCLSSKVFCKLFISIFPN